MFELMRNFWSFLGSDFPQIVTACSHHDIAMLSYKILFTYTTHKMTDVNKCTWCDLNHVDAVLSHGLRQRVEVDLLLGLGAVEQIVDGDVRPRATHARATNTTKVAPL